MRPLFLSETRCVLNLFQKKWGERSLVIPHILTETIATPARVTRRPWFNCDFILHFVDWRPPRSQRTAAGCSILPNALGAELFLVVEKETLSPTALELNGGGAFTMDHYDRYIDIVETAVREALVVSHERNAQLHKDGSPGISRVKEAAFARILIVGNDITFLYSPGRHTISSIEGRRVTLSQAEDRQIDCYLQAEEVLCFDGWIRTEVITTKHMLVSMPAPRA